MKNRNGRERRKVGKACRRDECGEGVRRQGGKDVGGELERRKEVEMEGKIVRRKGGTTVGGIGK